MGEGFLWGWIAGISSAVVVALVGELVRHRLVRQRELAREQRERAWELEREQREGARRAREDLTKGVHDWLAPPASAASAEGSPSPEELPDSDQEEPPDEG